MAASSSARYASSATRSPPPTRSAGWGPNLDQLKPPKALVLDAVLNGRQRGAGTMPAGLYTGQDAEDVASYVAAVAGKQ